LVRSAYRSNYLAVARINSLGCLKQAASPPAFYSRMLSVRGCRILVRGLVQDLALELPGFYALIILLMGMISTYLDRTVWSRCSADCAGIRVIEPLWNRHGSPSRSDCGFRISVFTVHSLR
jgi:hypothetical protein